ncbi:L-proline glycine betaine binding ABC transporter protein ProX (TC 3.A.1.12.1) [hydrothermal vent metagenome]|uniref:L-proline glycine betaine binding ABC transporter protein ProX (TC 3.A.1.12.1) n=1 Tax=hydrothermal vent metagenome TaxID=652676 RepID=A0A3B0TL16_9ZZZZ
MKSHLFRFALCLLLWPGGAAIAATDGQCRTVRFSDMGAPDLVIKTAAVAVVLEALGYRPQTQPFSQAETFAALANGEIDVFLGADRRKMNRRMAGLQDRGAADELGVNQRVKSQELGPQKRGPPAAVAAIPATGGTEAGGAGEASGTDRNLNAGDQEAKGIETLARTGFAQTCPNVGKFIRNLTFPPQMTVFIARRMATEYEELFDAAVAWFDVNRDLLDIWLAGVKTTTDGDAVAAVLKEFGF